MQTLNGSLRITVCISFIRIIFKNNLSGIYQPKLVFRNFLNILLGLRVFRKFLYILAALLLRFHLLAVKLHHRALLAAIVLRHGEQRIVFLHVLAGPDGKYLPRGKCQL